VKKYDYVIVGAGICGCTVAYELQKYSKDVLLIDKNINVGMGASGAAGAFLSPLLGKPNKFKNLISKALSYSTDFYKINTPESIDNCGTIRIPKDDEDELKFQSYIPFMDFKFEKDVESGGYFFPIGSVVNSFEACTTLSDKTEKLLNYEINIIEFINEEWILNKEITTNNLILATGANVKLLDEKYIDIRAIWGQRIDIETSTCITKNYHKECSVSRTIKKDKNTYKCSIGATHHRFVEEKQVDNIDTEILLKKASDIILLNNVKVTGMFGGARSSSSDYFPIVGTLVDSTKTLIEFPYLKNGTNVNPSRFSRHKHLHIINGVGGRGFVLAPYLANQLVENIINNDNIEENIKSDRLFKRWVKK